MAKPFRSIRSRVASAMFIPILLILPVVLLALYYVGQMNNLATLLAETDAELLRVGNTIFHHFFEVRNAERNFLLSGDSLFLTTARITLKQITVLSERGRRLDPELKNQFDSLTAAVNEYRQMLDSLEKFRMLRPLWTTDYQLNQLQLVRQQVISQVQFATDQQTTDSLLTQINRLEQEIDLYQLLGGMRTSFHQRLSENARTIIVIAEKITTRANHRIAEHKGKINRLYVWSQRNIITAVLVFIGLLVFVVFRMPNSIVLPIKRIANALNRVENGDYNVRIAINTPDELGNLARQLNRVFIRLREIDDRKTGQIFELERRFRLLASSINEGVLVLDRTLKIIYANPAVEPLLGIKATDATNKSVKDLANLQAFLPYITQLLSGAVSHQECEIVPGFSSSAVCFEALRSREGTIIAALIVITNPMPPEPLATF
jgi:PAS domain-containing protein